MRWPTQLQDVGNLTPAVQANDAQDRVTFLLIAAETGAAIERKNAIAIDKNLVATDSGSFVASRRFVAFDFCAN